jgi:hypothetical protein
VLDLDGECLTLKPPWRDLAPSDHHSGAYHEGFLSDFFRFDTVQPHFEQFQLSLVPLHRFSTAFSRFWSDTDHPPRFGWCFRLAVNMVTLQTVLGPPTEHIPTLHSRFRPLKFAYREFLAISTTYRVLAYVLAHPYPGSPRKHPNPPL